MDVCLLVLTWHSTAYFYAFLSGNAPHNLMNAVHRLFIAFWPRNLLGEGTTCVDIDVVKLNCSTYLSTWVSGKHLITTITLSLWRDIQMLSGHTGTGHLDVLSTMTCFLFGYYSFCRHFFMAS